MTQPEMWINPGSPSAITVTNLDGATIAVTCPYSPTWNSKARTLDGRWGTDQKWWVFDARYRDRVLALLHKVFAWSETDDPTSTVTLHIDATRWGDNRTITLVNRTIATRFNRDNTVYLSPGVAIVEGHFRSSSGSIKKPTIGDNNAVLEWRDVSWSVAERAKDEHPTEVTIIADVEERRKALTARKQLLEQQLAEINTQLNALG